MYETALVRTRETRAPATHAKSPPWSRVIVVSNRLPYKAGTDATGKTTIKPSSGGLVTAMAPLLHEGIAGKWIGWLGVPEDEGLDEALRSGSTGQFEVGVVQLTQSEIDAYYLEYSNRVLTPLFAGEISMVDWKNMVHCWAAYAGVQDKFAERVYEDLSQGDIVWVQDYHLLGVGNRLRAKGVRNPIGFFLHTSFPPIEALRKLLQFRILVRHMLAYDLLGFQTPDFRENFVDAVRVVRPDARIDRDRDGIVRVTYDGRTSRLGAFPISIDANEFERQLYRPGTQANIRRLRKVQHADGNPRIIFDVGRQDYLKGFYEELLAFELLLERHPELIGTVVLYQLIVPSRGSILEHRDYKRNVVALAKRINHKYGTVVRQTHAHMGRERYLAYLHVANVLSVPTRSDGMNLVAKEGAIVGNPHTVLLLSEKAGAVHELGEHALVFDPDNIEQFAEALYCALVMKSPERRRRKSMLKSTVIANDVFRWWSQRQEPIFRQMWEERQPF